MEITSTIKISELDHCLLISKNFLTEIDSWINTVYKKENEQIDLLKECLCQWDEDSMEIICFEIVNSYEYKDYSHTIELRYFSEFLSQGIRGMVEQAKSLGDKSPFFQFLLSIISNCQDLSNELGQFDLKSDLIRLNAYSLNDEYY